MIRRFLLSLISLMPAFASATADVPPNIIVMLADDMGMGDTSAYQDITGNSDSVQIHTPAMEHLARMGVRFTDAHTPASRCSTTRYGLLTGRYSWRSRLKFWVLFGSQGDPLIETDRPTIASFLSGHGYRTGMVGKWHVGLRFRQSDGRPAAGFSDADLRQPLFDGPLDHGFDFARFTSRSHGTSGPQPGRRNQPDQDVGPGHIDGRTIVSGTDRGRQLAADGSEAYVLSELGGRHSDNAMQFLKQHVADETRQQQPFFLYYASNSNHSPYTPDERIGEKPVRGAARSVSGEPLNLRADFVYENDVALGRLLDWLEQTDDPRRPGRKLVSNTVVVFTSDNGAEIDRDVATGPFRSHKGSCFEGGHRVPLIVAWPAGGVGDGDRETPGRTCSQLIGLTDLFATFAEILQAPLPELRSGEKGAEDSVSMLSAWQDVGSVSRSLFFNDHKQADDPAVLAYRCDDPNVDGEIRQGQWKLFFDHRLARFGVAQATAVYELSSDPQEQHNRIDEPSLQPLVEALTDQAETERNIGGQRLATTATNPPVRFRWADVSNLTGGSDAAPATKIISAESIVGQSHVSATADGCEMTIRAWPETRRFTINHRGLGIDGGRFKQVDRGESILITFDRDVVVESVAIVAGNGTCGGSYQMGQKAPLAIYCIDADIDSKDQSGRLSDLGVLLEGETLRLDSHAHLDVEASGQWRLADVTVRPLD